MIESIKITGIKFVIDETTRRYVIKKVGRLDRYLPKHARKNVTADVYVQQVNHDHGNKYEVEVVLHLLNKQLTAKDSTVNVLAAVDIVEAKLVTQLHKYKETSIPQVEKRGVLSRFKRSHVREE